MRKRSFLLRLRMILRMLDKPENIIEKMIIGRLEQRAERDLPVRAGVR